MPAQPLHYQLPAIERHIEVFKQYKASLEASGTGFGKTFVALFVARYYGWKVAVLCPKSVISQWEEAAEAVGVELVFCVNYEKAKSKKFAHGRWMWRGAEAKTTKNGNFEWSLPTEVMLIFDEVHLCKNRKTQNSKLLYGAVGHYRMMLLSATVAENPMDLYAVGAALGLHDGSSEFWWFLRSHGVVKGRFGFVFNNDQKAITKIRNHIYPKRGHRINPQDIPGFPENSINLVTVTHQNAKVVERQLTALWDKMMEDMPLPVVDLLRARQEAELLKVDYMAEQAVEAIHEGNSVVIFLNFSDTIRALYDRISGQITTGISILDGEHDVKSEMAAFQKNEHHLALAQFQSGGVGVNLHDLHGRPRVSFLSPSFDARAIIQALGRVHRSGQVSKSIQYLMFLKGTKEEQVMKNISRKLNNISSLNDNDVNPFANAKTLVSK